jgi:hypothetical protein
MKIPMGKYKAVNQRTNNTLAEKKKDKRTNNDL